jgi:ADP-ribose pyrophosphatase
MRPANRHPREDIITMPEKNSHPRTPVYHCRIFDVFEETVRLPNDRQSTMSVIDHRPTIAVVPIKRDGSIVLLRQYRHATGGMLIEIPAGTVEKDDQAVEACAQRELAEEAGFHAGKLVKLFEGYLEPGFSNEYMHFFLALDLYPAKLPADEDEYIEVITVSCDEACRMIREKKIVDAKTALGILLARDYLEKGKTAQG